MTREAAHLHPSSFTLDPYSWKAPAEEAEPLIWPEPRQLLADIAANAHHLAQVHVNIQNVPLSELRREMRRWVGHDNNEQPLILTAHQTELYHPGVWVKNALIHATAEKLNGRAMHLGVDTDAPKHLLLRWPGGAAPITDDPRIGSAAWSGMLDAPSPEHLRQVRESVEAAAGEWPFRPMVFELLDSLRRRALESPNLPAALLDASHELDWSLGLRHHVMIASPMWISDPYLAFTHHLMAKAERFAADYNSALREYRARNRVRSPGRPMPDLRLAADECECPFWLDDLDRGLRRRAAVQRRGGQWAIESETEQFVLQTDAEARDAAHQLGRWLSEHRLRLAPRALTLTTFLRLFLADQFVHGIGGGRYDQVADALMRRHFGLEPPRFAVTTATLYFPGAAGRERVCLPCVLHEGHHLRHNLLGERKRQFVGEIDSRPRKSSRRREVFQQMHNELAALEREHPAMQKWRQKLGDARRHVAEEQVLFDRELFYALQPRYRLEQLLHVYNSGGKEQS